jgi:DNA recombination protein RmuC
VPAEALLPVLLGAAAGLAAGLAIAWFAGQRNRTGLQLDNVRLQARLAGEERLHSEREAAVRLAQERIAAQFDGLASTALRRASDDFLTLATQRLDSHQERARGELGAREKAVEALVKPITEALQRTQTQIEAIERSRQQAYGGIQEQLQAMTSTQQALQLETRNLVSALRRPEVRGQWGEMTLRRLVELAGMVQHCDFVEQSHVRTEDGALRPDMVIKLPEDRQLVVDVKTPLDAYLDAVNAPDDATREAALERHAQKVAERIRELASKAYWAQFPRSPEFVILFIPGDQFLSAALDRRPNLLDEALRQQVILATPSSFVGLLKAVAYSWRQMALAENAEQIRGLAVELYERINKFTAHLSKVGQALGRSVEAYNAAVGSLERKVLPGARKFTELGVKPRQVIQSVGEVEHVPRKTPAQLEDAEARDQQVPAVPATSSTPGA